MDSFNDALEAVKMYCRERLSDTTYKMYLEGIRPISFDSSGRAVLEVRSQFIMDICRSRYLQVLKDGFLNVLGFDVEIEFTLPEEASEPANPFAPAGKKEEGEAKSGHYAYTFENFIQGSGNKFAFSAAQAVANNPSGAYNPLFIYGNSGLGKTHLLTAIQLEVKKNHPDFNILFVTCEQFTSEIISAIHSGSTEAFKNKYRKVDMLLIDDIQFIAGKESTQEEFFYTFNVLHEAGKQIVIASDRPARDIRSLADRLRTRFEWGLTADIQPPEYETRVAIIRRKAALLELELPDEVVDYVANNLKENIRQLELAVNKLNAYYILGGIRPTIGTAQNAIRDVYKNDQEPDEVRIEKIINEVARTFNINAANIKSRKKDGPTSKARQVAMYVVREVVGLSTKAIGREFGRDHSTVVYSLQEMDKQLDTDSQLKETVQDIIKNIKG